MEMGSSRRPTLDRSREPELKKPRFEAEAAAVEKANPRGRAYSLRASSGTASISAGSGRYWSGNDNGLDSTSTRAEAYQPQSQPQLYHELVCQYKAALAELTFNSKPIITNLTIIAGENLHAAKAVTLTICNNILEVPSDQKLPSLYLLDSIVKNIGREYIRYFAARLPEVFCKAYRHIDPSMHQSMRHLFGTWKGVFPLQTLQIIEKELGFAASLNSSGAPSSRPDSQAQRPQHSIHVNPKYLERQRLNSRVKGIASDGSLSEASSVHDRERLDKVPGSDGGRLWVDKVHPPQREGLPKTINEKKLGIYGDMGYASDISKNSSPGIEFINEKISEPTLRGRSWLNIGGNIKETTSGSMNGFSAKPGTLNQSSIKPSRADAQLPSNSGRTSRNWKNSEEEEFMWDCHSRHPGHDVGDLVKTRRFHDSGLRFDRESSSELPSPWTHVPQVEKVIESDISVPGITYSDDYASTLVTSGKRLSSKSSSSLPHPDTMSKSLLPSRLDHVQGSRQSKLQKIPADDLAESSAKSSIPHQKSTTSSLLSAVMESGILSRLSSDNGRHESLTKTQDPFQAEASLKKLEPKSIPGTLLQDVSFQKSDPISDGIPPSSSPISDLLSSLVSKGLISASNSEISTLTSSQKQNFISSKVIPETHDSSIPGVQNSVSSSLASGNEESSSESALKTPSLSDSMKSESLIGLHFKSDVLRELHPQVLSSMFDNLPHKCTTCGLRLKVQQQLDDHLQMHTSKDLSVRNWYPTSNELDCQLAIHPPISDDPMAIADDNQFVCILCGELFEDYYNQELNVWMFKEAIRLSLPTLNGPIIHAKCSHTLSANTTDIKLEKDMKLEKILD